MIREWSKVKIGRSLEKDEYSAVDEAFGSIDPLDAGLVLFFCSSEYNLDMISAALSGRFTCPVIGCTTAGEISTFGYQKKGLVAAGISSSVIKAHVECIHPLGSLTADSCRKMEDDIRGNLSFSESLDRKNAFGLLFIDGMSLMEDAVISALYSQFDNIPIIGGSSGDDQAFKKTYVYANGRFLEDAAVFTIVETKLAFTAFTSHHFIPTEKKIVITEADPKKRIISEINGFPAADEYAAILGLSVSDLNPTVFSKNPVMIRIGGDYYIRSIQKVNPDRSLSLYCAIDDGLVLTIGEGSNIFESFEEKIKTLIDNKSAGHFGIFFDCILRRLEIENNGLSDDFNKIFTRLNFIGFSTYGEQFNSIHINQTLTGIILYEE